MENLLKELSSECQAQYADAVADGANEAHFVYADQSFHRYDIADLSNAMNIFRTRRLCLRLVKTNPNDEFDWEVKANLVFWNSFVDEREIFYAKRN